MSESIDDCSHIADTAGLLEIARSDDGMKAILIAALNSGAIAVPAIVWQEFNELYEDEANDLEGHVTKKIAMKKAYHIGAASIADSVKSSFTQSRYDTHADLYTAAICQVEDKILLTSESRLPYYKSLACCEVQTLNDLA